MHIPSKFVAPEKRTPCSRTYWVVDDWLLAGAYPGRPDPLEHRQRIESLFDAGMRTFINLQEENETNNSGKRFVRYDNELRRLASDRDEQIAHLRFPIPDGGTTSVDRMRCILDAIDLSLAADRPVYVHCFGGMGRTGTTFSSFAVDDPRVAVRSRGTARSAAQVIRSSDIQWADVT